MHVQAQLLIAKVLLALPPFYPDTSKKYLGPQQFLARGLNSCHTSQLFSQLISTMIRYYASFP